VTQPPPAEPVIVKIVEPPARELEGLADVLIGAIGLTGVITLAAVVVGFLFGSLMFWYRSRSR
jgi:hypothetical protein